MFTPDRQTSVGALPNNNTSLSHRKPKQNGLVGFHLPKGFVCRSEPADVAAGTEEDKPEDGQTKIDPVASSDPPRQARNYIHYQRDAVNCKEGRGKNVRLCSFIIFT